MDSHQHRVRPTVNNSIKPVEFDGLSSVYVSSVRTTHFPFFSSFACSPAGSSRYARTASRFPPSSNSSFTTSFIHAKYIDLLLSFRLDPHSLQNFAVPAFTVPQTGHTFNSPIRFWIAFLIHSWAVIPSTRAAPSNCAFIDFGYRYKLYKFGQLVGQLVDILTTFDTGPDLRRAVKEHIIDTEPEGPEKEFLLRFFDPASTPPWERKTMIRGQLPTPEALLNSLNDEGNAVRFEKEADGHLVYDIASGQWFAFITNHWELAREKLGKVLRLVGKSLEQELDYWKRRAATENTPEMRNLVTLLQNHVNQSKNHPKQVSLRKMIEGSSMQVNLTEASDDRYFTFKNGALDCKTGEIIPIWACDSIREKYPLIYFDRVYTPGLRSPAFIGHLKKAFDDNVSGLSEEERTLRMMELGRCFLRLVGYLLYPGNPEQTILFLWEKGSNGKSTTIDVLREIFGSEMSEASVRELYSGAEDRPASGIARSLRKRAMLIAEASDEESRGGRISADTVKALTGDAVTSRFRDIYEKSRPQRVVCTPVGVTNELPRFDKVLDFALLRRIFTIPFPHLFAGDERGRISGSLCLPRGMRSFRWWWMS
ncbi:hypothetical protein [uncultured Methanocorpusculum sp.]|nr:hypothetical protein [uncultured Methanocorpusculum sp.]